MLIISAKLQTVAILTLLAFTTPAYSIEYTPHTYRPDLQRKPDYGCKAQYGKLACRWEGECADLGGTCASCKKEYRYSRALKECYSCPNGFSLRKQADGQHMCS